jgi:hypothetical protein
MLIFAKIKASAAGLPATSIFTSSYTIPALVVLRTKFVWHGEYHEALIAPAVVMSPFIN